METWLVNFGVGAIGSLMAIALFVSILRLQRVQFLLGKYLFFVKGLEGVYLFLVEQMLDKNDTNAALIFCECVILCDPSCVEQIALLSQLRDDQIPPQALANLYVQVANNLSTHVVDVLKPLAYYTEAIELDPGNADIYCKRAKCYWRIKNYEAELMDYTRAALLYQQQGNPERATYANEKAFGASVVHQHSLKPKAFQPVSGKTFDAQSWQPLGDQQVLVLTGTRLPETIVEETNPQPSLEPTEVMVELHWRTYSVPIAATSEDEKVGYLGYFLYKGQRLFIEEDITSTYAGHRGDWERQYQAHDLELFCFNYLIEGLRGNDWHKPEAYLHTLQLTWEPTSQAWGLSDSNHRSGSIYNTSVYTSYKSSIRFDLQNLRAYYHARFYCDATD